MSDEDRAALVGRRASGAAVGVRFGGGRYGMRPARMSGGKSGGRRVRRFLRREAMPVFFLPVLGTSERTNDTAAERAQPMTICDLIAAIRGRRP